MRQAPPVLPIFRRELEQADEKKGIGLKAASWWKMGKLYFSLGTTVLEVHATYATQRVDGDNQLSAGLNLLSGHQN